MHLNRSAGPIVTRAKVLSGLGQRARRPLPRKADNLKEYRIGACSSMGIEHRPYKA